MSDAFQQALKVDDLAPGKMAKVALAGKMILIANIEGEFHAADDSCTHEEVSLCNGALLGDYVMCPYHGSRFNLKTGVVQEDPAEEDLRIYPVEISDGWVCVKVED